MAAAVLTFLDLGLFRLQSEWFRVFRVARCLDGDDPFADDGDLVARCFDGDAVWDTS